MSPKETVGSRKFTIRMQNVHEGGYTWQCAALPAAISDSETIEELKNMMEDILLVFDALEEKTMGDRKIVIAIPA
jgi:predicted RNase H-like HicB family nuclease